MADSDYNVVKPLESVQTIQGLAPAKRRRQPKQRQETPAERQAEAEEQPKDTDEPETQRDQDDPHSIDYCA